ncbi:MAG: thioredoxin family protein [Pirellulales bacterium]|jgi:peroxiredoxin|nr:thioredoxin family protein [Thermoguttaceae bacterium]MDD4787485.1 thioredoxin family protein [Pirellulales bacterium]MDI9444806.1 thioredoxin family protein [Planctomycetota bacterium]NLZ00668.1 thioredoxin family protein [Pirellulaceae bacterium]
MVRTFCLLAPVALLLSSLSPACAAGVKIGDKAPPWSGIIGIDDKEHSLADLKQAKAVVLVFTCNHCPVAQAYEDRLVALQRDYRDKGVRLVAVNVNNLDADKLGPMKVRAKEKQFNFPYLYDPTQKMGRDYGATKTPEIFVLDGERKIAYHGPVDDSQNPDKVKTQHLRQALDAILAGKAPPKAEVLAFGCTIKYDN